ncbi:hypothetical protein CCR95_21330 [Thiocystis minor]|nr:hypothetical protein [Thiocystis minor]
MRPVEDQANPMDERHDARMHFRTKPSIKEMIHRAAVLSGIDDSVFAMNAAYRAALETIATHERTVLRPEDHAAFFAALDQPPEPTAELRSALKRSRERTLAKSCRVNKIGPTASNPSTPRGMIGTVSVAALP